MYSSGIPFIATFTVNIPSSWSSGTTPAAYLGLISRTFRTTPSNIFGGLSTANSSSSGFYAWRISYTGAISIQEGTNNATASWATVNNNSIGTYTQPPALTTANYGSTATFSIIYSGNSGTPGQFQYAINGTVYCTSVVADPTNISPIGLGIYVDGTSNTFPVGPFATVTFTQGLGATGPTGNTGPTGATGITGPLGFGSWSMDATNSTNMFITAGTQNITMRTASTLSKFFSNEAFPSSMQYSLSLRLNGTTFPSSGNMYFGLVSQNNKTSTSDPPSSSANSATNGVYCIKIAFTAGGVGAKTVQEGSTNISATGTTYVWSGTSVPTANSVLGIIYTPSGGGGTFYYMLDGAVFCTSTISSTANIPPLSLALYLPNTFTIANSNIGVATFYPVIGPTGFTGSTGQQGPTGTTGIPGLGTYTWDTTKIANATTSGVYAQSTNSAALTAPSSVPNSSTSGTSFPPTAITSGAGGNAYPSAVSFPFIFTNEAYSDPFSITFILDNTSVPTVTAGTAAAAFNLYVGVTRSKTTWLTSTNSLAGLTQSPYYGVNSAGGVASQLTQPTGAWLNDLVPAFDYMFSVGRSQKGWNLTSMIENGGANGATASNYKETIFSTNMASPSPSQMTVTGTPYTYLNITYTGTSIVYTVNNTKWREITPYTPISTSTPLYGAIMLGILPSNVKVAIASFARIGSSLQGPPGPMGSSVLSIKPINNTQSTPAGVTPYSSASTIALSGNQISFTNIMQANTNSNPDIGGEWAFITAPIVSSTTVNFVINFSNGFSGTNIKRVEVGLRRIRNTFGGTPGADITQENPPLSSPFTDSNLDYSVYIVNDRFIIRAAPLVSTSSSTVFPVSTLNNVTTSANYGRLSVLTTTAGYTSATATPDVSLASDTTQAAWYTGPLGQPVTLNISIVYTGNTVSFYMNGTIITTKIGTSIPCITSSAPYYAAVRVLSQTPGDDTVSVNLLPAQGPTGPFTATNLYLVSKAPTSVLNMNNSSSISVVKSGTVNLDTTDLPFVYSANPLTGSFVLNFLFNGLAASATSADGGTVTGTSAVEFAVGLVNSMATRDAFDGTSTNPMLYGILINGGSLLFKTDSSSYVTSTGPNTAAVTTAPGNAIQMTDTTALAVRPRKNYSIQIKYDGINLSYYYNSTLLLPASAPTTQAYTFTPAVKGPYYLVMSFANGDQYSSIPVGQSIPPTNFKLQVLMSEIFGGPNSLLGTTLTHLQTFKTTAMLGTVQADIPFILDTTNSSSITSPEVVYSSANNYFTYVATDGTSKAMINLTVNFWSMGAFAISCKLYDSSSTVKMTTPGLGTTLSVFGSGMTAVSTYSLSMKITFLMNSGDKFVFSGYGLNGASASLSAGSTIAVEKLPVAQGGGGQRWVNVHPIPKRHPSRKSSLRISRVSTKKGGRK